MERLGAGRQAEVFALSEGECVKLFYADCPASVAQEEARRMRYVCDHGVPAPRLIGLMEIEGRLGIRMERLRGMTLLQDALRNFREDVDYGALLGTIQKGYHRICAAGLDDMVSILSRMIGFARQISREDKQTLIDRLERMPRGDRLVHLDYHSDNVIMTQDGARVIDWASACAGNPLADAARTLLTMEFRSYPVDADASMRAWLDSTRAIAREGYLRGYGARVEDIDAWKPFIAAARLFCAPEEERVQGLSMVRAFLDS